MEDYNIKLNTVLYFFMVNNNDFDSKIWAKTTILLIKKLLNDFQGNCLLYTNGYDVPILMRKNDNLIIDLSKSSSKVFDFSLLETTYIDKKIIRN